MGIESVVDRGSVWISGVTNSLSFVGGVGMRDDNGLTRLDMETKVALMAALLDDGAFDTPRVVARAIEIEQEAHRQVVNLFRERKLARAE